MASVYEQVNAAIFRELERLDAMDPSDEDCMAEIERAREVRGLTATAVSNANSAISAAHCMHETGMAVKMPKNLLGGE